MIFQYFYSYLYPKSNFLVFSKAFTIVNSAKNKANEKFHADLKLTNLDKDKKADEVEKEKFTFGEKMSHKIDHAALIIFPLSFLLFMIAYWSYYSDD